MRSIPTRMLIVIAALHCLLAPIAATIATNITTALVNHNHTSDSANGCPNCLSVTANRPLAERLKVEAIKRQILSKLNLPDRPNITTSIPRELIAEALRKAQLDTNYGHNHQPLYSSPVYSSPLPSGVHSTRADSVQHQSHQSTPANTHTALQSATYQESDGSNYISSSSDDYYGKPSEIIAFAEPGAKVNGHTLLVFVPPHDNIHRLEVTSATLWVQVRLRQLARSLHHLLREHVITLYIFRVVDSAAGIGDSSNLELISSHKMRAARPGWKHMDVRPAIQRWFSTAMSSTSKLTLLVDCVGCDSLIDIDLFDNKQPPGQDRTGEDSKASVRHNPTAVKHGYRPFVVIATQIKISRRSRRHTLSCDSGQTSQCCRQSLYVSFKQLGWDDWIIAPKGYYANYCVGECSKRRTPDTLVYFHSHVIEEYRNKNPYASITPCCAPTKLSAISLIYFDQELNIIKADLPKMVVDECGCT